MTNKEAISNIKVIKENIFEVFPMTEEDKEQALDLAIKALEERPQGEWINEHYDGGFWYHTCNHCKEELEVKSTENFCRNCGADMRKGGSKWKITRKY